MFANSLELVDDCGLTFLHVFPFSPRQGTPAARMPQVAGAELSRSGRHACGERGEAALAGHLDATGRRARRAADRARAARPHAGLCRAATSLVPPHPARLVEARVTGSRRQAVARRGACAHVCRVTDKPAKARGFFGAFRRSAEPTPDAAVPEAVRLRGCAAIRCLCRSEAPPRARRPKQGWFQRLKAGLTKTSAKLSQDIAGIFTKRKLDADTLQELEDLLIQADLGVETAARITDALAKGRFDKEIATRGSARGAGRRGRARAGARRQAAGDRRRRTSRTSSWSSASTAPARPPPSASWRSRLRAEGKKVMLAAGDTFRAAAIEQLKIWGERTGAEVIARGTGADAAGLAFDALQLGTREKQRCVADRHRRPPAEQAGV